MPVDVEHHPVAVHLGAPVVRQPAQPGQVVARVQGEAVLAVEPLTGVHLRFQLTFALRVHAVSLRLRFRLPGTSQPGHPYTRRIFPNLS